MVAITRSSASRRSRTTSGTTRPRPSAWRSISTASLIGPPGPGSSIDGVLDRTLPIGAFTPEATSIQHAALGTAMNSSGAAAGFFQGRLDEARVWNLARSDSEIATARDLQLTSGTGLIARWGLNEASGTFIRTSVGAVNGTTGNFAQIAQNTGVASGTNTTDPLGEPRRRPEVRVVRHRQRRHCHHHRPDLDLQHRRQRRPGVRRLPATSPRATSPPTPTPATSSPASRASS